MAEDRTLRRSLRTSREDEARPLKDFIARHCPEAPAGFLNKLLRKGFVLVDGEPGGERTRLRAGQQVAIQLPAGAFLVAPNPEVRFRVIYEDDSIAVLEKPRGSSPSRASAISSTRCSTASSRATAKRRTASGRSTTTAWSTASTATPPA